MNDLDIQFMKEHGWNIVRLGVQMAGVLVDKEYINMTYLKEQEKLINRLGEAGIYTLVDFHIDLLSEYACGEGFPTYVTPYTRSDILDFPLPVTDEPYDRDENNYILEDQCKQKLFSRYYNSDYVQKMYDCLYNSTCNPFYDGTNTPEEDIIMQDEYIRYWFIVSKSFAQNPYVIGYDLLNEPNAGSTKLSPLEAEQQLLYPLYERVIQTILMNDKNHLIFFEPFLDALKTSDNEGLPGDSLGLSPEKQVFDWHLYCETVSPEGTNYIPDRLCNFVDYEDVKVRMNKANVLGVAQIVSEFGAVADTDDFREAFQYDVELLSKNGLSWCHWAYKYFWNDKTTAFNAVGDQNEGIFHEDMTQQSIKVKVLSHPYAQQIAANINSTYQIVNEYNFDEQKLTLSFETGNVGEITRIVKAPMYIDFGKCYQIVKGSDAIKIVVTDTEINIINRLSNQEVEIVFY